MPGAFGLNLDERRRELREDVERNLAGIAQPSDCEHSDEEHDDDAEPQRGVDEPAHALISHSEFDAVELGGAVGDDRRIDFGAASEHDEVVHDVLHLDAPAGEDTCGAVLT